MNIILVIEMNQYKNSCIWFFLLSFKVYLTKGVNLFLNFNRYIVFSKNIFTSSNKIFIYKVLSDENFVLHAKDYKISKLEFNSLLVIFISTNTTRKPKVLVMMVSNNNNNKKSSLVVYMVNSRILNSSGQ